MLNEHINQLIWHFSGYIHLAKDIGTYHVDYGNAHAHGLTVKLEAFDASSARKAGENNDNGSLFPLRDFLDADAGSRLDSLSASIPASLYQIPNLDEIVENVGVLTPPLPTTDSPGGAVPATFTTSFFYRVSGTQTVVFNLDSGNTLIDNDTLVSDQVDTLSATGLTLDEIIAKAGDAMPDEDYIQSLIDLANAQTPDFLPFADGSFEDLAANLSASLAARAHAMNEEGEGPVGGEGAGVQTPEDESSEVDLMQPRSPEILTEENLAEGNTPDEMVPSEGGTMGEGEPMPPAPMSNQVVHLGSNEAINAAAIVNTSEAGTAMIIHGDYFESNIIIQTNIYSFNNNANTGPQPTGMEMAAPGSGSSPGFQNSGFESGGFVNFVSNVADMSRDSGDVAIPAPIGFSLPAYNFYVDYVTGNFFDINIVTQTNDLTDNDTVVFETMTNNYLIETGDNSLINATQIFDLYAQYDLIIVAGSYNEVNFIKQTNIMLDHDSVSFDAAFGSASGMVEYDHNRLSNDATIHNIGGGDLFNPITQDIEHLSETIQFFDSSLTLTNSEIDFGMPVNFTADVNVLYVSGDFYQLNAIFQTNILTDIDAGLIIDGGTAVPGALQSVNAADKAPAADPVFATGDNLASNQATIIDYDSQSGFQYLGGEFYEQDVLIQVDIIAPDDGSAPTQFAADNPGGLVNEVIAFTGEDAAPSEPADAVFVPTHLAADSADMMGHMMT